MISISDCIQILLTAFGVLVAAGGVLAILWQIKRSGRDALANALMSSISNRWQMIEDMKIKVRVERAEVTDERISSLLKFLFKEKFGENIDNLVRGFGLTRVEFNSHNAEVKAFDEVLREYRIRDLIFTLCEEEWSANWLGFVKGNLWEKYWLWYLDETFKDESTYYFWWIRRKCGTTHKDFVKFVLDRYPKYQEIEKRLKG